MKAAVFYGKQDVRIEDIVKPSPGPNQLLVKMNCVGLCGTDVDAYQTGSFLAPNMVLGHENIGTVVEVGDGVSGYAIGDRLLCGPPSFCEELCPSCRHGLTNICETALEKTRGIGGPNGGYAEYMLVQDVKHAILKKLPDKIKAEDAVLYDVVCVGIHAIRLSRFRYGDNVVVSGGGGPVGLSMIRLLKAAGAGKIAVLQRGDIKTQIMKEFGADYVIDPTVTDNIDVELKEFFGDGKLAAVTFECAGTKESLYNCLEYSTRPGGQVMMVGQITEPIDNIVPSDYFVKEIDMLFSFVFVEEDVDIYLKMIEMDKISFPGMVTSTIGLQECVEKGLALPREEKRKNIKILIKP